MGLSRANSLKKASPLLHFKQFQQHLENLKNEVQVYNKRQNCSYALNMMPQSSHNQKRFLKKMTEPKYHKVVIGLIEAKEKAQRENIQVVNIHQRVKKHRIKQIVGIPDKPLNSIESNITFKTQITAIEHKKETETVIERMVNGIRVSITAQHAYGEVGMQNKAVEDDNKESDKKSTTNTLKLTI